MSRWFNGAHVCFHFSWNGVTLFQISVTCVENYCKESWGKRHWNQTIGHFHAFSRVSWVGSCIPIRENASMLKAFATNLCEDSKLFRRCFRPSFPWNAFLHAEDMNPFASPGPFNLRPPVMLWSHWALPPIPMSRCINPSMFFSSSNRWTPCIMQTRYNDDSKMFFLKEPQPHNSPGPACLALGPHPSAHTFAETRARPPWVFSSANSWPGCVVKGGIAKMWG